MLVEKSVLVGYSAQRMFDLVERVEDYHAFLPWCGGAEAVRQNGAVVVATVRIDYRGLKQSFTTENTYQAPQSIAMKLKEGPFSHLEGSWRFIPLNDAACKIEFKLHYLFSSKMLEKLVSPVFDYIANSFVDAFVKRAEEIYGES
jgi:ribosome-associated toxin RatA of RatAB toxin-antitoxin module